MRSFLLRTVTALGTVAPASAADLPARTTYAKAPAYVAPIYNWTGFYIGGHLGGAFAGNNSLSGSDGRFLDGNALGPL
jgi:outer membrane immunogenic protein